MWSTVVSLSRSWGLLSPHNSVQNSTKGCPNPAASACHAWARHAGSRIFLILSRVSAFLRGLSGAGYGPTLLPLGNISISKARRASAALTNVGTAPHLLLCARIAARQGDTNEKTAISQPSDCETLCSRRLRREGMMEEGSAQGRLLQGQEESPEGQALLPGLHAALTALHPRAEPGERLTCLRGTGDKSRGCAQHQGSWDPEVLGRLRMEPLVRAPCPPGWASSCFWRWTWTY